MPIVIGHDVPGLTLGAAFTSGVGQGTHRKTELAAKRRERALDRQAQRQMHRQNLEYRTRRDMLDAQQRERHAVFGAQQQAQRDQRMFDQQTKRDSFMADQRTQLQKNEWEYETKKWEKTSAQKEQESQLGWLDEQDNAIRDLGMQQMSPEGRAAYNSYAKAMASLERARSAGMPMQEYLKKRHEILEKADAARFDSHVLRPPTAAEEAERDIVVNPDGSRYIKNPRNWKYVPSEEAKRAKEQARQAATSTKDDYARKVKQWEHDQGWQDKRWLYAEQLRKEKGKKLVNGKFPLLYTEEQIQQKLNDRFGAKPPQMPAYPSSPPQPQASPPTPTSSSAMPQQANTTSQPQPTQGNADPMAEHGTYGHTPFYQGQQPVGTGSDGTPIYKEPDQSAAQGQGGDPPVVNTPEEAMQLPPGTRFMTPDGRLKTVPQSQMPSHTPSQAPQVEFEQPSPYQQMLDHNKQQHEAEMARRRAAYQGGQAYRDEMAGQLARGFDVPDEAQQAGQPNLPAKQDLLYRLSPMEQSIRHHQDNGIPLTDKQQRWLAEQKRGRNKNSFYKYSPIESKFWHQKLNNLPFTDDVKRWMAEQDGGRGSGRVPL